MIAQNLQAAAVRECQHHGGSAHSVVDVSAEDAGHSHGAPAPEAPHRGHEAPSESDSESHHGPCDCLGPCGASTAAHAPASSGDSAFVEVAPRRVVATEATDAGLPRHVRPFFLPYPNAPPA
ncbi:MAG: hypothetical protein ACODAB_05585 [Gemmatimonadota bacterium]